MSITAEPYLSEADALLGARQLEAALDRFHEAESVGADPDRCAAGRWMIRMLQGDFEAAWRESDAIATHSKPPRNRLWQGESLHGKRVMLRCLHGFGDAVQFLRYAPLLRAMAASLVVEVNPRFLELAGHFAGVEQVITWGDAAPAKAPEWDVQIEIMELPYLFRTKMWELPLAERYLRLPARDETGPAASGPFRVGLVWTAGEWNPDRSIPFSTLHSLLTIAGCEFWSLVQEGADRQPAYAGDSACLRQDPACQDSIVGLAESIQRLDLVVTVDTLAAHLAGALGTPCWLLLQHAADWRWMHEREDSSWYPSLRLFRQKEVGNWFGVIESVRACLQELLAVRQREGCDR